MHTPYFSASEMPGLSKNKSLKEVALCQVFEALSTFTVRKLECSDWALMACIRSAWRPKFAFFILNPDQNKLC